MFKKLISSLLVFTLTINFVFFKPKQADAIAPVAAPAIAVSAGLLTAGGIVFLTDDAAKAAGYKFYTNASSQIRASIDNAVNNALNGIANIAIGASMWDAIRNFVYQTDYGDEITYMYPGETVYWQNSLGNPHVNIPALYGTLISSINESGSMGYLKVYFQNADISIWSESATMYVDDRLMRVKQLWLEGHNLLDDNLIIEYVANPYSSGSPAPLTPFMFDIIKPDATTLHVIYNGSIVFSSNYDTGPMTGLDSAHFLASSMLVETETLTLTTADFQKDPLSDDPRWDLIGSTLALSTELLNLIGQTPQDIVDGNITYPEVTYPGQEDESGLLGSILSGINNLNNSINNSIDNVNNTISNFYENVVTNISNAIDNSSIITSISETITTVGDFVTNFPTVIGESLTTVFCPSETYLSDWVAAREIALADKGISSTFLTIHDSFDSFITGLPDDDADWPGIKANFGGVFPGDGIGELYVAVPDFVNEVRQDIKFWISGLLYLLTSIYVLRKASATISGRGGY